MVITLYDLSRYDFFGKTHLLADVFFDVWINVCIGAYRARQLADSHFFCGSLHAVNVSERLGVPKEQLQTEGGRFCMDTVGAADGRSVLEFDSSSLQDFCQLFQILQKDSGGLFDLYIEAGILHVGGGKAHVDVLGIIAYIFPDIREESDDVVIDLTIDLVDALDIKVCLRFDHFDSFLRNAAQLCICFAGCDLYIKHCLPFISFIPDLFHDWTCVPRYHQSSPFG